MEQGELDEVGESDANLYTSESESSSIQNMNYSGPKAPGLKKNKAGKSQKDESVIVFFVDKSYITSCLGLLRIIQVLFSLISLVSLTTIGKDGGDFLQLPLSSHFRIMMFVLLVSSMTSLMLWLTNASGLVHIMPLNWYLVDTVLYSVFAFLYLIATSLLASVYDFYERVRSDIPRTTNQQLVFCVILGYISMCLYGLTAIVGYRRWSIQQKLFKRRRLLEEEQNMDI